MSKWFSSRFTDPPRLGIISDILDPPPVKEFRKNVANLSESDSPLDCVRYFIDEILPKYSKDIEKYRLSVEIAKLLPMASDLFFASLSDEKTVTFILDFIAKIIPFYGQQPKIMEILPSTIHKILELNNKETIELSAELIHTALRTPWLIQILFKGVYLSRLWESTFVKYPNTAIAVGPLILHSASAIHFIKPDSIFDLLRTSLRYITTNSLPLEYAAQAYEFISYAVREIDCTDYIVQIMPKLASVGTSLPSLRFFENFLIAPVMTPVVTWTPLSEICASKDANPSVLHNALDAIHRSRLYPPTNSFSFAPFAKSTKLLSKEDNELVFELLSKVDNQTKIDFISACFPLETTGASTEALLKLVAETQWDIFIGQLLSTIIANIPNDNLMHYLDKMPDFFAMTNAACDQIFPTCKASVAVLIKLSELGRNNFELVASLISKVLDRTSTEITIPQVVLEVKNNIPEFVLDTFANAARRILSFNSEFFKQDYQQALEKMTNSLSGLGLLSALAVDGPVEEIDSFVENNWALLEKWDQKVLTNLMYGLPPKSETAGFIRIPSLIPHIQDLMCYTPFDKYLASKYLKNPTKDQQKLYVSQSFSVQELDTIRNDPELLFISSNTREPQKGIIQFHPQARQCLGHTNFTPSTSFWFFPYETSGRTTIASYSNATIELSNEGLTIFGNNPIPIESRRWHLISILTTDTTFGDIMTNVYLDSVFVQDFNLPIPETLFFGAAECSSIWLLSPSFILDIAQTQMSDYVNRIFADGPFNSTLVSLELSTGPKSVPYDGILRHIPSLSGKLFIFDEILKCTNEDPMKLNYLFRTAFNLFNLGQYSNEPFMRLIRYVLLRQDVMYSKEIENILFEGITKNGEINWSLACSMFTDYRLLTSIPISFSFIDRIIECNIYSQELVQLINSAIETYALFTLTQTASEHCLNLIEVFVQRIPTLLKKVALFIEALPYIESDSVIDLSDKSQIDQQTKLYKILTRSPDAFRTVFSPSQAFQLVGLLDDKLALNLLDYIANICIENPDYYIYEEIEKLKPLFRKYSQQEKFWITMFVFLTQKRFSTLQEYSNVNYIRKDMLALLFTLIRNIITEETDQLCFLVLTHLVQYTKVLLIPLNSYSTQIQAMCSLGFNERDFSKMPFSINKTEEQPKLKRKISSKMIFSSAPNTNILQYINEIQDLDSSLLSETTEYLTNNQIDCDLSKCCSASEPLPQDFRKLFQLESTKLIIVIAANTIFEAAKINDGLLKNMLICLTIFGADTAPEISSQMHQLVILAFLKLNISSLAIDTIQIIFEFITFRVIEGWWDDAIIELYSTVLLLINNDNKHISQGIIISPLCQAKTSEIKIQLAKKLVHSAAFLFVIPDADLFSSFLCLIISKEMMLNPDSKDLYTSVGNHLNDSELKRALLDNSEIEWLDSKPNVSLAFQEFYNNLLNEATDNSTMVTRERQYITRKSKAHKYVIFSRVQNAHAALIRRAVRYQFFIHYNLSSLSIDFAIDLLFKFRNSISLCTNPPGKSMFGLAPSPLVPPMKLIPCVIEYEAAYAKNANKVKIPKSYHKQSFTSKIEHLIKEEQAPRCFEGWMLPSFLPIAMNYIAKLFFNPILPFASCAILNTPESLPCVAVFTKQSLQIITNASLLNGIIVLHDISEMICHSAISEPSPYGLLAPTTLFGNHSVLIYHYSMITNAIPRKYIHENTALDLYTYTGSSVTLILGENERKNIINRVNVPKAINHARGPLFFNRLTQQFTLDEISKLWSVHAISTFEYLLLVNGLGTRSFNDLSQYPVFPWVIGDYVHENGKEILRDLTKPLGNIGQARAQRYLTMFQETDSHYFYGTHYSYPASVLHFMMRLEPFTLYNVNLHGGFDHKDRLFCNISESWNSASNANQADLKELIPQFFCISEMLTNINSLPLTERTDGTNLSNVVLPAWAHSPREFIWLNRKALESNSASEMIPDWIDLVFGYKQKGQAAIDAINLFHPLTYEDTLLEHKGDAREMKAQIDAINNFGQCPHQVFTTPHTRYIGNTVSTILNLEMNIVPLKHFDKNISSILIVNDVIYASKKFEHVTEQFSISVKERYFEINKKAQISDYNYHVQCSALSSDKLFLAIGCQGGLVSSFLFYEGQLTASTKSVLNANIYCIAISSHLSIIVASSESELFVIDLTSGLLMRRIPLPEIEFISIDEVSYFILVSTKNKVHVFTQNLELIAQQSHSVQITSMSINDNIIWSDLPFFVTGHSDGSVSLWTINIPEGKLQTKHLMKMNAYKISAVLVCLNGNGVLALDSEGNSQLAVCSTIRRSVLQPEYFHTCAYCFHKLEEKPAICPICGIPVCSHCWSDKTCTVCQAKLTANDTGDEAQ